MRTRLRPKHSDEALAELYSGTYDHTRWDEHTRRVGWTISRLNEFLRTHPDITRGIDLSCGDGEILRRVSGLREKIYSDITPAEHLNFSGPIEQTIMSTRGDILVCSETLEHLDDPDIILDWAASRFTWICVTTPLGEVDSEKNYEHYWGWDLWGVSDMLSQTGWAPRWVDTLNESFYTYQLWIARTTWD